MSIGPGELLIFFLVLGFFAAGALGVGGVVYLLIRKRPVAACRVCGLPRAAKQPTCARCGSLA
jgi:hypothetical protein